jgi:hypothetical protein
MRLCFNLALCACSTTITYGAVTYIATHPCDSRRTLYVPYKDVCTSTGSSPTPGEPSASLPIREDIAQHDRRETRRLRLGDSAQFKEETASCPDTYTRGEVISLASPYRSARATGNLADRDLLRCLAAVLPRIKFPLYS